MDIATYKQNLLDQLYAPHKKCNNCMFGNPPHTIVCGEGDANATIMFIGEAPGREEAEQGRPFVGRSGKLLTKTIELLGVPRSDVFITNVVKCRPPGNRTPLPHEVAAYKQALLDQEIKIIQPKIICTLGACPTQALLGRPVQITKIHGQPIAYDGTSLIPIFHPAYILRNQKKLGEFVQDIQSALELAGYQTKSTKPQK